MLKTKPSVLLLVASFALGTSALAQQFPSRPVRMLVGNPAGGPADLIARTIGDAMSGPLGQPVIVENRPGGGAGGALAMNGVATAATDGYTIGLGTSGPLGAGAVLNKLQYDVIKSFTPVSMVSEGTFFLMVAPSLKVNNMAELLKYVKANPGKLNYGSDGIGSTPHLGFELFKLKSGTFIVHIPYNGADQKTRSFLAGDTQIMIISMTAAMDALIKEGRMKPLAVTYERRLPEYPDVPAMKEVGLPEVLLTSWFCIVGPAGLPADVTARLNREVAAALARPEAQTRIKSAGQSVVRSSTPEELGAYIANQNRQWKEVVAKTGIKIEQ
jgi:tripartite-type tricarboxylate transporter receptor subunit TctC